MRLFSSPRVPPSSYSAAALAARLGTDLVQPKGRHEMCISDELPAEGINSLTRGGNACCGRQHVTACASARTGLGSRGSRLRPLWLTWKPCDLCSLLWHGAGLRMLALVERSRQGSVSLHLCVGPLVQDLALPTFAGSPLTGF